MWRNITLFFILLSMLTLDSCKREQVTSGKMNLTVSIIPQKYLADFIAGDKFDVQVMLPPGANHETYEPSPGDMEKFSSSKLYLANGAFDFELTWLERFRASNLRMQVINTSKGIEMIGGHVHGDENSVEHRNTGTDPHIWLSTTCMKIQASNICNALEKVDSVNAPIYKKNLLRFNRLADSVDQVIRSKLSGFAGKSILVFHPAFAYFVRDYNLVQINIEQEGKEPSPANLKEIIKTAEQKGIKSVFISKEFDIRNAEVIAREIGGKVVIFDPMAENWPENMIHLADLIAKN